MPTASALGTAASSSLRYMPGLDVMRGIAISMVLIYHGLRSYGTEVYTTDAAMFIHSIITGSLLLVFLLLLHPPVSKTFQNLLAAIQPDPWLFIFSGLILFAFLQPSIATAALGRPFVFLANISYGLYLCHQFLFSLIEGHWRLHLGGSFGLIPQVLLRFIAESAIAIGIAWVSRRTLEEYFLRLKPKHKADQV